LKAASKAEQAEDIKPKSMIRPKVWSEEVEEAYRFQVAGYRDEREYISVKKTEVLHKSTFYSTSKHFVIITVIPS